MGDVYHYKVVIRSGSGETNEKQLKTGRQKPQTKTTEKGKFPCRWFNLYL